MSKKFYVASLVCLMMVIGSSMAFAASGTMGDGKPMSEMMMTQDQMTALTPEEMTAMCKNQNTVISNKRTADKMMSMMTAEQVKLMTEKMMNDQTSMDKMMSMGTKDDWMAMDKDQKVATMDKMMLTMTPDQMSAMTDAMMPIMTKEQMVTMMMDNNSSMAKNKKASVSSK